MLAINFMTQDMPVKGEEGDKYIYLFLIMVGNDNSLVLAVEPEFYEIVKEDDTELVVARAKLIELFEPMGEMIFNVPEPLKEQPALYVAFSEKLQQIAFSIKHPFMLDYQDQMSEIFGEVISRALEKESIGS
ncbi:MAG: hypothetical protein DRG24_00310 [Epsilonproteobacteria bacterium]|nr:MAG: hypothetical protein DRG24_00310 [Campylobacterota bacterium]